MRFNSAIATSVFVIMALIISPIAYGLIESSDLVAASDDDNVIVTLNVDVGISITDSGDTNMSQNLGILANTAIATSTWNVKTNNATGYILAVKATTSPAMEHTSTSDVISDYTPAVAATPETWSVANGTAEFGFSAFGARVSSGTWGSDTNCGAAHTPSGSLNYRDFDTSDITIASHSATTTPSGDDTTVCYAVEQNGFYVPSGEYQATIVATATTL